MADQVQIGRHKLRVPTGSAVPDVPLWMGRLATDLSDVAKDNQGPVGGRPASSVTTPGVAGRWYTSTDETGGRRTYRDHGGGYDEVARVPITSRMLAGSGAVFTDDSRLGDWRTPLPGSVIGSKIAARVVGPDKITLTGGLFGPYAIADEAPVTVTDQAAPGGFGGIVVAPPVASVLLVWWQFFATGEAAWSLAWTLLVDGAGVGMPARGQSNGGTASNAGGTFGSTTAVPIGAGEHTITLGQQHDGGSVSRFEGRLLCLILGA